MNHDPSKAEPRHRFADAADADLARRRQPLFDQIQALCDDYSARYKRLDEHIRDHGYGPHAVADISILANNMGDIDAGREACLQIARNAATRLRSSLRTPEWVAVWNIAESNRRIDASFFYLFATDLVHLCIAAKHGEGVNPLVLARVRDCEEVLRATNALNRPDQGAAPKAKRGGKSKGGRKPALRPALAILLQNEVRCRPRVDKPSVKPTLGDWAKALVDPLGMKHSVKCTHDSIRNCLKGTWDFSSAIKKGVDWVCTPVQIQS